MASGSSLSCVGLFASAEACWPWESPWPCSCSCPCLCLDQVNPLLAAATWLVLFLGARNGRKKWGFIEGVVNDGMAERASQKKGNIKCWEKDGFLNTVFFSLKK